MTVAPAPTHWLYGAVDLFRYLAGRGWRPRYNFILKGRTLFAPGMITELPPDAVNDLDEQPPYD